MNKKSKNKIIFTELDLYWSDAKKKEYIEALEILNNLTEKQKSAVQLFGYSRWQDGNSEGYNSCMEENGEF